MRIKKVEAINISKEMDQTTVNQTEHVLKLLFQSVNLLHRSRPGGHEHKRHDNRGQGRLLALLLRQDGLSHKDIVREMDIRPSSAGELVSKLEHAGYVMRSYNENDKRVCNVYLTEEGREVARRGEASHSGALAELFSGLTAEELQQLGDLMEKLNASLRAAENTECDHRHGEGHRHHHGGHRHHMSSRREEE